MIMTREEAIAEIERLLDCAKKLQGPQTFVDFRPVPALEMALSALRPVSREQLEKVWESCEKCKCCPNCIYYPSAGDWPCQMCDKHQYFEPRNFCSFCGKPLTDEAVQIRLKELEALKDGNDRSI